MDFSVLRKAQRSSTYGFHFDGKLPQLTDNEKERSSSNTVVISGNVKEMFPFFANFVNADFSSRETIQRYEQRVLNKNDLICFFNKMKIHRRHF